MLDVKLPTRHAPEPLPPAEHEKAMALLEARSRRLQSAPEVATDQTRNAALPQAHSTFND